MKELLNLGKDVKALGALYGSAESPYSTPENNITLRVN